MQYVGKRMFWLCFVLAWHLPSKADETEEAKLVAMKTTSSGTYCFYRIGDVRKVIFVGQMQVCPKEFPQSKS